MFALRGSTIAAARLATGRTQIALPGDPAGALATALTGEIAGLRASIAWWALVTAILAWALHRLVVGNWILAAGGAPAAARTLGVPVARVKIGLFALTATGAWLVALIQMLRFGGADALRGQGQEFHAIVAAVIGGSLLTGGHGSVVGAAFGALIYGIARQGMVIAGVDADWFQAALGALLLAAAWLNHRARIVALREAARVGATPACAAPTEPAGGPRHRASEPEAAPADADVEPAAVLEARGVSRHFGAVRALDDVSLRVRAGRVTCLVGDNGAGKSTLIRLLSGVDRPDRGTVRVDGRAIDLSSPAHARELGIAVVHQDLSHAPLLSVWRNFALGSPARPFARLDEYDARAATSAATAPLGLSLEPLGRPLAALSGGQRQALAIARALALQPRALVLDEPTASLGVGATAAVLRLIRKARDGGTGILLVTHDPRQAAAVADDVVVLVRGRVAEAGEHGAWSTERLRDLMRGDP
jgi:ABC-type multidrug transport system ATPase subunit